MKKGFVFLGVLILVAVVSACAPTQSSVSPTITPGEWDYVVLGDSISSGYPRILKELIEEDYNGSVTITIKNWYQSGQTSSQLLQNLQTNEELREDIRNAELITFFIPWGGCRGALTLNLSGESCRGEDNQDCLREFLETYKSDTTAIFAEVVSLRSPSEALIRVHDVYQFYSSSALDLGVFDVINGYWREGNAFVHATAESYGIPVAHVYDAFMGDDGMQPPEENGLVGADKIHTTAEGQQVIADLLHELGYELATK